MNTMYLYGKDSNIEKWLQDTQKGPIIIVDFEEDLKRILGKGTVVVRNAKLIDKVKKIRGNDNFFVWCGSDEKELKYPFVFCKGKGRYQSVNQEWFIEEWGASPEMYEHVIKKKKADIVEAYVRNGGIQFRKYMEVLE